MLHCDVDSALAIASGCHHVKKPLCRTSSWIYSALLSLIKRDHFEKSSSPTTLKMLEKVRIKRFRL